MTETMQNTSAEYSVLSFDLQDRTVQAVEREIVETSQRLRHLQQELTELLQRVIQAAQ